MNDLKVFENIEFGKIRAMQQNNEIYFVAKDVCDALKLKNSRVAVTRLDEDEVRKFNLRRFNWRSKHS